MTLQTWSDVGIALPPGAHGEVDTLCPECSHTRTKRTARCLSVNTIDGVWFCHHCGWSGGLGTTAAGYGGRLIARGSASAPPKVYTIPTLPPTRPLPAGVITWFAGRGIPESALIAAGITAGPEWCPQLARETLAVRFPYFRDGNLVNIKYRALSEKLFWMVKGAQRIFYGLDGATGSDTACVVEREMDALSIRAAGGPPTLSVPDGAPPPDAKHYASKFAFLDGTATAHLRAVSSVLIATDMDAPGERLAEELARRIWVAKCRRVSWLPYKDANAMIVADGAQAVLAALANAHPMLVPKVETTAYGARPIRLPPPARGRRSVVTLEAVGVRHAR